ncbi:unnamed protein product [Urochloa humidicola]
MALLRRPPELMNNAIAEILLCLPPVDPACLPCASLVCKSWCCLLSDTGFPRRYREFHRAPPLLGFLSKTSGPKADPVFRLVPIAASFPSPLPELDYDRQSGVGPWLRRLAVPRLSPRPCAPLPMQQEADPSRPLRSHHGRPESAAQSQTRQHLVHLQRRGAVRHGRLRPPRLSR